MTLQPLAYYHDGILQEDRRILAKAITLVESQHPDHTDLGRQLVASLSPHTGQAVRVGITGVPGVGKSTFIESFGMLLMANGHRVAVLAVDPSSKRSGGSIMADKTRMERLATHPHAFIRPSPSGKTLGGVARMTRESMLLCEAAGFDVIIVETVGVGQNETTVAGMVDFFLVLMLTGAGDALQGIKKGILELADAVVINKADGANREPAEQARRELASAMHLMLPTSKTWTPPVLTCSALSNEGLPQIWDLIQEHGRCMRQSGELEANRREQSVAWMWSLIEEGLRERFNRHPQVKRNLPAVLDQVRRRELVATEAAAKLLFLLDN
jgi:LAO/AO transport system kinase